MIQRVKWKVRELNFIVPRMWLPFHVTVDRQIFLFLQREERDHKRHLLDLTLILVLVRKDTLCAIKKGCSVHWE